MKISKIEKIGEIHLVTLVPNFIEQIFGVKEKIERYKHKGEVYKHFPHIKVFYKSNGEMLRFFDKMCKALNNYENSF